MSAEKGLMRKLAVTESLLLTLAMGVYFNNLFHLRIHIVFLLIFTIGFLTIIYLFDQYKNNLLTYVAMAGTLIAFGIISIRLKINYFQTIQNVYEWCLVYNGDENLYKQSYGMAVVAGIILLCCVITYYLHRIKIVKGITGVILIVLLLVSAVIKVNIPKVTVGIIIFYSLWVLAEYCGKLYYKSSNTVNNSIATVYLAPACIIIALLSVSLPSYNEPIKWTGVIEFIHRVQEQGANLVSRIELLFEGSGHEFSLSIAGYSEDTSSLGGEVNDKDEIALKIRTIQKSTGACYLIGSISDTYTGHSWEKSKGSDKTVKEDYYYDFYELLYAFAREKEAGSDLTNIIKNRNVDIEYYNIRTRSLFYPLKTLSMNLFSEDKFDETPQGAFLSNKAKGIGFKYNIRFFELNLNHSTLQNMLRKSNSLDDSLSTEALYNTAKDVFYYDISKTNVDINEINRNRLVRLENIKKRYTTLPDSLPDRVKQLTIQLTDGYPNDYDKLKAIEAYLNTLTYTTRVGKTPKNEDFVDYFLFQQKQGYCTYFATAFAVMARCVGIPTRYVEGFIVDFSDKDNSGAYLVNSKNAHAWVEAYVDGVGWIPFEPTPAFYQVRYAQWQDFKQPSVTYDFMQPNPVQPSLQPNLEDLMDGEREVNTSRNGWIFRAFTVTGIIVIFIVLFLGTFLIYYKILTVKYGKKYERATNNEKLFLLMAEILHYLKKEGYCLREEETLLIFAERIGNKVKFNETNFKSIAGLFMDVRYGEYEIKTEDLGKAMDFAKAYRNHLVERLGNRKMFFDRFLYLHFSQ